jgi:3-hydroxyethyl bacteriochlorophyllide a dehydrogenase
MKSKAIVFTGPYQVELEEIEIPEPNPGELLIQTLYSGISTGTEMRVISGKQSGGNFPLIPGYENVGKIVRAGDNTVHKPGDIVFHTGSMFTGQFCKCWGAHQEYALVNASDVCSVPAALDPEDAIYAKVGAIALHGVKRAHVDENDTVAVVGLGLIGHLAAQCAKAFHARVIGVDTNQERLNIAAAAGIEYVVNASQENVQEKVNKYTEENVSVAIDVTGIADTIKSTARLVRSMPWSPPYPPSPKLVILGSYSDPITLDYDSIFMNEVDILVSRDTRSDDIKDMLVLLSKKKVNPRAISAKCYNALDAQKAYRNLVEQKPMRVVFKWY